MHGKKAVKKFKPSWKTEVGPGGEITKKYVKKTRWQCDVDLKGDVVLKQTQLSFTKTTSAVMKGEDTEGGPSVANISTDTVGQDCVGSVQPGWN